MILPTPAREEGGAIERQPPCHPDPRRRHRSRSRRRRGLDPRGRRRPDRLGGGLVGRDAEKAEGDPLPGARPRLDPRATASRSRDPWARRSARASSPSTCACARRSSSTRTCARSRTSRRSPAGSPAWTSSSSARTRRTSTAAWSTPSSRASSSRSRSSPPSPRRGSRAIAFEYARAHGRRRVTAVHKANIMKLSDGLFLDCVRRVAEEYPDIASDDRIVDAASAWSW